MSELPHDHLLDLRDTSTAIERVAGLGTGWFGLAIEGWCRDRASRDGLPFQTFRKERHNARGERIGPDLRISAQAAAFMLSAAEAVSAALDDTARDYALQVEESS